MKQSERRAKTHAALVRQAMTEFARDGYEATPVEAVAAAAGYSKGALYSNFASKLDLFLAVVDACLEEALVRTSWVAEAARNGVQPLPAARRYWGSDGDERHGRLMIAIWNEAARVGAVGDRLARHRAARDRSLEPGPADPRAEVRTRLAGPSLLARLIDAEIVDGHAKAAVAHQERAA